MTEPRPELPWGQVPQWVMVSNISPPAKALFVLLVMHVVRKDPANRQAWPRRERLAAMLGYARPDAIDSRVRELERLGAITVHRGRDPAQPMQRRNTYTVRLAADGMPNEYSGPPSVWDFDEGPGHDGDPCGEVSVTDEANSSGVGVTETPNDGSPEAPPGRSPEAPPEGHEEVRRDEGRDQEKRLPDLRPGTQSTGTHDYDDPNRTGACWCGLPRTNRRHPP